MKIAVFSFSEEGGKLGDNLIQMDNHEITHYKNREISGGIKSLVEKTMKDYEAIVFISSTGIAIRFIAPYIKHKTKDPAIISIDDLGRFTISLLSGHLGGANKLTKEIAKYIESIPVITTASDIRGFEALDLFIKKNNYYIEDKKNLTKIMAMMVNEKRIGFLSEDKEIIDYPYLKTMKDINNIEDIEALIIISSKKLENLDLKIPYILLRPKNINIGIGCKKGISGTRIIGAIERELDDLNLSNKSIKDMATVEIKKDEEGIISASRHYNSPLKIFTIEELKKVEDKFEGSDFVKKTIGVSCVSEPCAYLLGGEILSSKSKHNGITISISKE